jgi:hypothetical protein
LCYERISLMQYLVTGGAEFIGSNMREVAFVCARHNPLDGCPFPPWQTSFSIHI